MLESTGENKTEAPRPVLKPSANGMLPPKPGPVPQVSGWACEISKCLAAPNVASLNVALVKRSDASHHWLCPSPAEAHHKTSMQLKPKPITIDERTGRSFHSEPCPATDSVAQGAFGLSSSAKGRKRSCDDCSFEPSNKQQFTL